MTGIWMIYPVCLVAVIDACNLMVVRCIKVIKMQIAKSPSIPNRPQYYRLH